MACTSLVTAGCTSLPPSLRPNTPPPSYWGVRERLSAKGLVGMAICWQRLLVLRAPGKQVIVISTRVYIMYLVGIVLL